MPLVVKIKCSCGRVVEIPPPPLYAKLVCRRCGARSIYHGGAVRIAKATPEEKRDAEALANRG
jgi:hypothetical protein